MRWRNKVRKFVNKRGRHGYRHNRSAYGTTDKIERT
jgi:hypothetical protein